ncbi:MAG TPA: flavin reductase family protein [Dehalococcoidia bacterium]|nr:flavin reductase family protein [Dehalococcoidia bacterium]
MFATEIEKVMHEMPYGLYIIGSKEVDAGRVNGMMADWVMQVSFEPRLVAVAFEEDSHTLANIRARVFFTVNLLSQDKETMDLARRFAQPYSGEKVRGRESPEARAVHYKLEGVPYTVTENGVPVLDAAMAWFECQAQEFIPIGDHYLAIGEVLDGAVLKEAEPMTSTYTGWMYSG